MFRRRCRSSSFLLLRRLFSSPPPNRFEKLPYYLRVPAESAGRNAVAEYLHTNGNLPLHLSQTIASTAPSSLASFLSSVPFPAKPIRSAIAPAIRRHLDYFPLHELDFFLESIGCSRSPGDGDEAASAERFFLRDNGPILRAAMALNRIGFPWSRIGALYTAGLLSDPADRLLSRFSALAERFQSTCDGCVAAACITFPELLSGSPGPLFDGLVSDVSRIISCFTEIGGDDTVDKFLPVFRKVKAFHGAGVLPGTMVENLDIVVEASEVAVNRKMEFFARLGMRKDSVGPFVLCNRELLALDMEGLVISVPEYLCRVGVGRDVLSSFREKHSHLMGTNRLINLPGVLHALGLAGWFRDRIIEDDGSLQSLTSQFVMDDMSYHDELSKEFLAAVQEFKLDASKAKFLERKEFLLFIGLGENKRTARAISMLHVTRQQLESRFNFLLKLGLAYPELLKMILSQPNLLNQSEELLQKKVNYLVEETGHSLMYLYCFPSYLCIDLEHRFKPRYKMLLWLQELGLLKKMLAPASVCSYSEKNFVEFLYTVHPAAPKHWLERFSTRLGKKRCYKDLFYNKNGS